MSQLGLNGFAGEVGHMVVSRGGRKCQCGSRGCWETEIGESALLNKAGRRRTHPRGAAGVIADALDGQARALAAVHDIAGWLGFGVANIANLTDPELVICGGYLADVVDLCRHLVEDELARLRVPSAVSSPHVVGSALGPEAALVGAAELAFDHLLLDPARTTDPTHSRGAA